jgi:hypothetical protein
VLDHERVTDVVAIMHDPDTRDDAHAGMVRVMEGGVVSMTTARDEDGDVLPAASVAETSMVVVPCVRVVTDSDHAPKASVVVVALPPPPLADMRESASAVPDNAMTLDVETAPSEDGTVMTGAAGGVVSALLPDDAGTPAPDPPELPERISEDDVADAGVKIMGGVKREGGTLVV